MNTIEDYFSTEFKASDNPSAIVGLSDSTDFSIPDKCCIVINAYRIFKFVPPGFDIICIDQNKTLTHYLSLKNVQVYGYIINKGIIS